MRSKEEIEKALEGSKSSYNNLAEKMGKAETDEDLNQLNLLMMQSVLEIKTLEWVLNVGN